MTETPQLSYCEEEVEDILLLCYANYFGRYKQRHFPALMEISDETLVDFTYLQFEEWKKGKCKTHKGDKYSLSASFDMQGPRKVFRNQYINLKKWQNLTNLTGVDGPEHSLDVLIAARERNLRVLTVANFFYLTNSIPSLNEIYEALEVYMKLRNGPFGKACFCPDVVFA
ncbi:hypothetical protein BDFB_007483 [Asbolus verrucosus]|uniref:Uncharacterized protein n=1 Tax=Asbolus verrucosus TaxID=1661398 RepID=A0A482W7T9_ASBVE|nr:hypothetical protein BDFB_007483 [Asbolus verrucosus]